MHRVLQPLGGARNRQPFEQSARRGSTAARWLRGKPAGLPGIRFYPVRFTPTASKYSGQVCQGIFFVVTDREALRPVRLGAEIAAISCVSTATATTWGRLRCCWGRASRSLRCVRAVIRPRSPPGGRATKPAGGCCGRSICSTDGRHGAARRQGPSQLQEPPAYAGRLVPAQGRRSEVAGTACTSWLASARTRTISRAGALQSAGLVRLDSVVYEEPTRPAAQVQLLSTWQGRSRHLSAEERGWRRQGADGVDRRLGHGARTRRGASAP